MIGYRVPVLDKGWIELQDLMGDDNAAVALRARHRSSVIAKGWSRIGNCCSI